MTRAANHLSNCIKLGNFPKSFSAYYTLWSIGLCPEALVPRLMRARIKTQSKRKRHDFVAHQIDVSLPSAADALNEGIQPIQNCRKGRVAGHSAFKQSAQAYQTPDELKCHYAS